MVDRPSWTPGPTRPESDRSPQRQRLPSARHQAEPSGRKLLRALSCSSLRRLKMKSCWPERRTPGPTPPHGHQARAAHPEHQARDDRLPSLPSPPHQGDSPYALIALLTKRDFRFLRDGQTENEKIMRRRPVSFLRTYDESTQKPQRVFFVSAFGYVPFYC